MNLYQRYRPETFEDMIGNESELGSLKCNIEKENRPHVFLFYGESGCGKTTAARICAKIVGAGELSITEINSSNNRGIDTARQMIDNCQLLPIDGTASAFIVDEIHQTTKDWQNAMLKVLEDTPDHVYFFLCTTDPQKLLKTFRNRCSEIHFNPIADIEILRLLRKVNKMEGAEIGKEVLEKIVDNSKGSARKALVLLEKCIGIPPESALIAVDNCVGDDNPEVIELCRVLLDKRSDWQVIADMLKKMKEAGIDPESIRYAVMGYMGAVLLNKNNPRAAIGLEFFSEPFYNSGFNGVILACYQVLSS